jgi:hypothetical protein
MKVQVTITWASPVRVTLASPVSICPFQVKSEIKEPVIAESTGSDCDVALVFAEKYMIWLGLPHERHIPPTYR